MDGITVREARPDDVGRILTIAERGWNDTYGELLAQETIDAAMTEWYDPDDTRSSVQREDIAYLVVETDAALIGYLSGGPTDEEAVAVLEAIYVDPDHWRAGAGTALLNQFEAFCRREAYDRIRVRMLAENEVGRAFYEKHGYEVVEAQETTLFGEASREVIYSATVGDGSAPE